MTSATFDSLKRPLLVGIISVACSVGIAILWLKFPSLVPTGVFVVVGIAAAATFLVSEVLVVLRVATELGAPRVGRTVRNLPRRTLLALVTVLLLCNGALLYFYQLRPPFLYILATNVALIVAWLVGVLGGQSHTERTIGGSSKP